MNALCVHMQGGIVFVGSGIALFVGTPFFDIIGIQYISIMGEFIGVSGKRATHSTAYHR